MFLNDRVRNRTLYCLESKSNAWKKETKSFISILLPLRV